MDHDAGADRKTHRDIAAPTAHDWTHELASSDHSIDHHALPTDLVASLQFDNDRYDVRGVIGRGGMGIVVHVYDRHLHRDLALKIIADRDHGTEDYDRFIEEAQISGQLEHPGIVPVYDVGRLSDGRIYFTMRLVKGVTLAKRLRDRASLEQSQSEFLQQFEQICQAVAYAHTRGVIHRDLKPANVMLGLFGDVHVMDWGIAKVIPLDPAPEFGAPTEPFTDGGDKVLAPVQTIRGSDPVENGFGPPSVSEAADGTRYGTVFGTTAYMSPEQALGQLHQVDCRSDVFALGGMLCEIITGYPPYACGNSNDRHLMAVRGDLEACLARIEQSPFPVEIKSLAKQCLAMPQDQRPADASMVAAAVSQYVRSTAEKLKLAQIEKAAMDVRIEQAEMLTFAERRRRQFAVSSAVLAAGLLITVGIGLLTFQQYHNKIRLAEVAATSRTQDQFRRLYTPAERLLNSINSDSHPPSRQAQERLHQLADAVSPSLALQAGDDARIELQMLQEKIKALELQVAWVNELDAISFDPRDDDLKATCDRFVSCFKKHGLSEKTDALAYSSQLRNYPPWSATEIVTGLEKLRALLTWCPMHADQPLLDPLVVLSNLMSDQPWQVSLWKAIRDRDVEQLVALARDPAISDQPEASVTALAESLLHLGPGFRTGRLATDMHWQVLHPESVSCSIGSTAVIQDDGKVILVGPAIASEWYTWTASMPSEDIRAIRLETFASPGARTPGRNDEHDFVVENDRCLISEIRFARDSTDGSATTALNISSAISSHAIDSSRELYRALDNEENSFWAVVHRKGLASEAAYFGVSPVAAARFPRLRCVICTGDPKILGPTLLGCFRVAYSTDSFEDWVVPEQVAIDLLESIVARRPNSRRVLLRLADLSQRSVPVDISSSIAFASAAISLDPQDAEAIQLLQKCVLSQNPNVSDAWYRRLLGHVQRLPAGTESDALLQQVVEFHCHRGETYFQTQPELAMVSWAEALRLAPQYFDCYGKYGWLLFREKQIEMADRVLSEGIRLQPERTDHWLYYARYLESVRRDSEALKALESARSIDAGNVDVLKRLALQYLYSRRVAEAQSILGTLKESGQLDDETIGLAALQLAEQKHPAELEQWFQWWLAHQASSTVATNEALVARVWGQWAMALVAVERDALLIHALEHSVSSFPMLRSWMNDSIDCALMQRNPERSRVTHSPRHAMRLAQLLVSTPGCQPDDVVRAAIIALVAGDTIKATEFINRVSPEEQGAARPLFDVVKMLCQQQVSGDNVTRVKVSGLKTEAISTMSNRNRDLAEWLWWEYRAAVTVNP